MHTVIHRDRLVKPVAKLRNRTACGLDGLITMMIGELQADPDCPDLFEPVRRVLGYELSLAVPGIRWVPMTRGVR
jgi:hypothetical protein